MNCSPTGADGFTCNRRNILVRRWCERYLESWTGKERERKILTSKERVAPQRETKNKELQQNKREIQKKSVHAGNQTWDLLRQELYPYGHFEIILRPILSRKSVGWKKELTDRRCSGWGTSWGPAGASSAWRTSWRLASRRSSRRSTGCCRPTPPSRGSRSSSRPTSFCPERLTQKVEVPLTVKQKPSSKI